MICLLAFALPFFSMAASIRRTSWIFLSAREKLRQDKSRTDVETARFFNNPGRSGLARKLQQEFQKSAVCLRNYMQLPIPVPAAGSTTQLGHPLRGRFAIQGF